jgi:hypothetical protein
MTDAPSRAKAIKAAAKKAAAARVLEQFEHDWAEAERLATTYPGLFQIIAPAAALTEQADSANPRASSPGPQKNERQGFDGTVRGLIARYKSDRDSGYQKISHGTRQAYDSLLRRLENELGSERIADFDAPRLKAIHAAWTEDGKRVAIAHSLVTILRMLSNFGATWLKNADCRELKTILSGMQFKMPEQRSEELTTEHAIKIRKKAHEMGFPSIALAQAIQFECRLKQRDVIGEWVPVSDSRMSDVIVSNEKWVRGPRWEDVDEKFNLRRGNKTVDLKLYPMVREELEQTARKPSGPIVVYERTGLPYQSYQFRRMWRLIADAAEIPKNMMNMDSRAPARLARLGSQYKHLLRKRESDSPQ